MINLNIASDFLTALAGKENRFFTFCTFDDKKLPDGTKRGMQSLLTQEYSQLDEHRGRLLTKFNEGGAGIFVTVNETDQSGRRKAVNMTRPRALFADFDSEDAYKRFEAADNILPASLVVATSPGKLQAYWLIEYCDMKEYEVALKMVPVRMGSDSNAADICRVLRIPGFYHNKGNPVMVEWTRQDAHIRYTLDQVVSAFNLVPDPKQEKTKQEYQYKPNDYDEALDAMYAIDPSCEYHIWIEIGMAAQDAGLTEHDFDRWSSGGANYGSTKECAAKWKSFKGGGITKATLFKYARDAGWKPKDNSIPFIDWVGEYDNEDEPVFEWLKKHGTTKEDVNAEFRWAINKLLAHEHHTVIWGDSGSFKTTWAFGVLIKECIANPLMIVHYWGFDISAASARAAVMLIDEAGLADRFHLMTGKVTSANFKPFYTALIKRGYDLFNTSIVIDTFKFITTNVNDKNANKEALHFIKQIQTLGAAILSLGHANKDGKHNSGTAELEQDSDALINIRATGNTDTVLIQFSKGDDMNRVRFGLDNPVCYKSVKINVDDDTQQHLFWYAAMKNMAVYDGIDFEDIVNGEIDSKIIEDIRSAIYNHAAPISHTELINKLKILGITFEKARDTISKYEGKHWKKTHGAHNKFSYSLV